MTWESIGILRLSPSGSRDSKSPELCSIPRASSIRSLLSVEVVSWDPSKEIGVFEFVGRKGGGVTPLSSEDEDCARVGGFDVGVDVVLMARTGFLRISVDTTGKVLLLYGSSGRGLSWLDGSLWSPKFCLPDVGNPTL